MDVKKKREVRQPILSKAEALDFAANQLEKMAMGMELIKLIANTLDATKIEPGTEADESLREITAMAIEPDIQIASMKAGAKIIRSLAIEGRVMSARGLADKAFA